jgi:hypothetical protein
MAAESRGKEGSVKVFKKFLSFHGRYLPRLTWGERDAVSVNLATDRNGPLATASGNGVPGSQPGRSRVCYWCLVKAGECRFPIGVELQDCPQHSTRFDQAALFGLGKGAHS